jgi:hypothetical protein
MPVVIRKRFDFEWKSLAILITRAGCAYFEPPEFKATFDGNRRFANRDRLEASSSTMQVGRYMFHEI